MEWWNGGMDFFLSLILFACTPAIILWLSFRQSCFFHDLEISIALYT